MTLMRLTWSRSRETETKPKLYYGSSYKFSSPCSPAPAHNISGSMEGILAPLVVGARVASEISRNEISRNVSRNFYFAFREIF
jgi:hypothetical protein